MLELNLSARRGSFHLQLETRFPAPLTVLFGPSGSGKTSLLRLIAGLARPDSGRIVFDGNSLSDSSTRRYTPPGQRQTGLVAQQSALFPHLSVSANVAYGLASLSAETQRHRIAEMLNLAGAGHLANRSPRTLSGGEAQRVALARTLAPMPRLLLLDEPLSALDAAARDQILTRLLAWLTAQEIQTILVTHDAADALAFAAEVAVLHEGRLVAQGSAWQVLAEERTRLLTRLTSSKDIPSGIVPHVSES